MHAAISDCVHHVEADRPQGRPTLSFLPILGPSHDQPAYSLLEGEALNLVRISEVSAGGTVPELLINNGLDVRLFLMDGQELVGAKQNRILNTDVLVPARQEIKLPVSCVEAGRWSYHSAHFAPGKAASHTVRARKHDRVHASLRAQGGFNANQMAVWQEVACSLERSGSSSSTGALHHAYEQRQKEHDAFRAALRVPEQAVGVAVLRGGEFLGLDVFDRHSTLKYFWQSLVESYAIDWLMDEQPPMGSPECSVVCEVLAAGGAGDWEGFDSPGEGRDWRLRHDRFSGSALLFDDAVVLHLQMFPKTLATADDQERTVQRPRTHRPWAGPRREPAPE